MWVEACSVRAREASRAFVWISVVDDAVLRTLVQSLHAGHAFSAPDKTLIPALHLHARLLGVQIADLYSRKSSPSLVYGCR